MADADDWGKGYFQYFEVTCMREGVGHCLNHDTILFFRKTLTALSQVTLSRS